MSLVDAMSEAIEEHQREQVRVYAQASGDAGAAAAPSPKKTDTSTGRALESLGAALGRPPTYDPGIKAVYRVPAGGDFVRMVSGWKPGQDVVTGFGVGYDIYFEHLYETIPTAHAAGVQALKDL